MTAQSDLFRPQQSERRSAQLEVRAAKGGRRLEGYAALYDKPAQIGGKAGFVEVIKPGAFTRSITSGDVVFLVDHDPSRLLGRQKSGTLRLSEDTRGLAFDLQLAETELARSVLASVERRDAGGMSFGFGVPEGGDVWTGKRRELRNVDLVEVSLVMAWPAYEGTIVNARSALGRGPSRVTFARHHLAILTGGQTP